ncbi:MAG TPA: GGDEF domain-containing protein [Rhodocyclaceae bacterium]
MSIRFRHSLVFRIGLVGLFLVALGTGMRLAMSLPFLQSQILELASAQQLSIASYAAADIDGRINRRLQLIGTLAHNFARHQPQSQDAVSEWVRERQELNSVFNSGLLVVRPDGKGLLGEYPVVPKRAGLDFSQTDWFRDAVRGTLPVVGKPYRGRADGDPIVVMAAAARDQRGQLLAVIAGVSVITAPGFLDPLLTSRIGDSGGFLLISPRDNLFVFSSDPSMILKPTPPAGVNLLHDRAMAGFRGSGVTVNAKGVEELSAMASVPATGWFVVARLPTAEALRPVDSLRDFFLRNSVLNVAVVLGLMFWLLPRMLRPLREAAKAMHRMADGRNELKPLPAGRPDEVGEMVAGFNFLLEKLQRNEASLRESEGRLAYMAHHDVLTGLPNRVMFEDRLAQALARAERSKQQMAVLFCDLDGFKPVNDEHGHAVGDLVLQQVAERLSDGRRRADTVARLGGDEFVILLPDLDDARSAAAIVAQQCIASIQQPIDLDGRSIRVCVSIGVALYPQAGDSGSQLLSCADAAMYRAKQAGKGRYVFLDE